LSHHYSKDDLKGFQHFTDALKNRSSDSIVNSMLKSEEDNLEENSSMDYSEYQKNFTELVNSIEQYINERRRLKIVPNSKVQRK
jgi:hypothetical protein